MLKSNSVRSILLDDEGLLWMGMSTYGFGVKDRATGKFTHYTQMLDFPAETLPVTVTKKTFAGKTVANIRRHKFMHGVSIRSIKRAGIEIPVLAQTKLDRRRHRSSGSEVESAAVQIGYMEFGN